jgi:hypothetical protein
LKDAGEFITKLPKAEHEAKKWQAAMSALLRSARRTDDDGEHWHDASDPPP